MHICSTFQESRKLKFWYVDGTDYYNQVTTAYEFFKELVRPENFPRGNPGFALNGHFWYFIG